MLRDEAASLVQRLHDAQNDLYQGGDPGPCRRLLTADVVWHVPGDNAIAGTYTGIDAVLDYMRRRRDLCAASMRMQLQELLVGDADHIACRTSGSASRAGRAHHWTTVGLYRIAGDRIAECWLLPLDASAFDAVWR